MTPNVLLQTSAQVWTCLLRGRIFFLQLATLTALRAERHRPHLTLRAQWPCICKGEQVRRAVIASRFTTVRCQTTTFRHLLTQNFRPVLIELPSSSRATRPLANSMPIALAQEQLIAY